MLKLRFVCPMYLCSHSPHGISQTTPRHLLADTISSPEDRILLVLIVGLKILRLRCFSRICFKDSPKSVVYGKITLDINSENPLCYFFFCFESSIWGKNSTSEPVSHASFRCSGPGQWRHDF